MENRNLFYEHLFKSIYELVEWYFKIRYGVEELPGPITIYKDHIEIEYDWDYHEKIEFEWLSLSEESIIAMREAADRRIEERISEILNETKIGQDVQ